MTSSGSQFESRELFRRLKLICVPLLGHSILTPSSTPVISKLLSDLINELANAHTARLSASIVSYTFFPISTILRRNASSAISDQILEKILIVLGVLSESWWWDCDLQTWDQIFMLCGSVVGGVGGKEKENERDNETKLAAVKCLWALLHPREDDVASKRLQELKEHVKSSEIVPIIGQTINHLLGVIPSTDKSLQRESLRVLKALISIYVPQYLGPSILPGITSAMTRVALGASESKGWVNGDIVELSMQILQEIIVISINDDVCIRDGAVKNPQNLEDLVELVTETHSQKSSNKRDIPRFATARTASWVTGASSQLHIALNTLVPLVAHPNPSALTGLAQFSSVILANTSLTLPKSHPLLLSFLLSISNSSYPTPSNHARQALAYLLDPSSKGHHDLVKILVRLTRDNISSLPQLIVSHAENKVEHVSGLIEATCRIHDDKTTSAAASIISHGIGSLLGPSGGIEKWGWGLLSVLELTDPAPPTAPSASRLSLESDPSSTADMGFPEVSLRHIQSRSTVESITSMFRALGSCGGEECLYAVEWFADVGRNGATSSSPAALWCAAHLLEGISAVNLDAQNNRNAFQLRGGRRIEKFARGLARSLTEIWDQPNGDTGAKMDAQATLGMMPSNDSLLLVEHKVGLIDIRATPSVGTPMGFLRDPVKDLTPFQHGLALRLLSTTVAILQSRFTSLLLHTLYPILHSIVSSNGFLSLTGLVTLHFVTNNTGYASPANLLLSNFDYALDAISHRLSRRWLDVDATKVLILLVRLVGSDIVHKAGDVVEECFDRLDDFHGYDVLVDGLVEVLSEVVKAVESDESVVADPRASADKDILGILHDDDITFTDALEWFVHRNDPVSEEDPTDYGPAPREAWGKGKARDVTAPDQNDRDKDGLTPELPSDPDAEPTPTPAQALTKQIVAKSVYFLTHSSAVIRMRILLLLSSSVPVLSESALLTSIHQAWPFIMNRLSDPEPFVVRAAASLVESLTLHVGSFMYRRIWDDVWPRFHVMLKALEDADGASALTRRRAGTADPSSAYTHAHRLYRSLLKTMTAAVKSVETKDNTLWEVIIAFRRFLDKAAHEELQRSARAFYICAKQKNEDAVWLALSATTSQLNESKMEFLATDRWSLEENVRHILVG